MKTIHAVYENGVFRPLEAVDLPERTEMEVVPKTGPAKSSADDNLKAIYEVMSRKFHSGHHDLAARHNDHQP
jgi:predicted DNA-binding antitoxin AbrB/MazE fold protein